MEKKPDLPSPWDLGIELGPGESVYMDESVPSLDRLIANYRRIRGNVIASAITIEYALDSLLVELIDPIKFAGLKDITEEEKKKIEDLKLIVNSTWLKTRHTNMRLKIDMLGKTAKFHPLLNEEEIENLVRDLHKVHDIRNDFAHRMMVVKQRKTDVGFVWEVYLDYGDTKELLTAEYFKRIDEIYRNSSERIENLKKNLAKS